MIIDKPGKVNDRILLLGSRVSNLYLLNGGSTYALLGGGMIYLAPDIERQVQEFGIDPHTIRRMIILHAHFDHIGVIPYLKKRWNWAEVCASARAAALLNRPEVLKTIKGLNRILLETYQQPEQAENLDLPSFSIQVEHILNDGDKLTCGDLTLEIIAVPGHSSCSIAIYVPEIKALFASDAGGIPCGKNIMTAANSNFDQYMVSLERLSQLDCEVFLPEHHGAVVGEAASRFLAESKKSAIETRIMLESLLAEHHDIQRCAAVAVDKILEEAPHDGLPKEVILIVVNQMLAYLSKTGKSALKS